MEIAGNENLIKGLRSIAGSGRVASAYMITGDKGTGKLAAAEYFAKTLLCTGDRKPCGRCMSCLQAETGSHPDIVHVRHEKPGLLSVSDVRREINDTVRIKPYYGPYKVYIVDEAELMNVQAQNALLKTLEEPPAGVVILLLSTSADVFLETIRSRAVLLHTQPMTQEALRDRLIARGYERSQAAETAALSGGSLGKALQMAGSAEHAERTAYLHEFLLGLPRGNGRTAAQFASKMAQDKGIKEGTALQEALDYLRLWFRDLAVASVRGADTPLLFSNDEAEIRRTARKMRPGDAVRAMEAVDRTAERLNANVNPETVFTLLALELQDAVQT